MKRGHTVFIIALCTLCLAACAPPVETAPETPTAEPPATDTAAMAAPAITEVDAEGLAKLVGDAKGKIAVVNFWATWCPPCVAEMPELASFYNDLPEGVEFFSVSIDHPSTVDDAVKPFLKEHNIPFDVINLNAMPDDVTAVMDVGEFTGAVPITVVYDKDGARTNIWYGEVTEKLIREALAD